MIVIVATLAARLSLRGQMPAVASMCQGRCHMCITAFRLEVSDLFPHHSPPQHALQHTHKHTRLSGPYDTAAGHRWAQGGSLQTMHASSLSPGVDAKVH
jgi:hypothetical protein